MDTNPVMIQHTLFQDPDSIIKVGDGVIMKYEDWLYAERKRFRKHGRKAEIRKENKKKALFVDKAE
jgi:hypothetical protein